MKKIFVVDDSSTNLMAAEDVLSEHYDVFTMLSVTIMFDIIDKVTPDLILLDIMMPDIDGFEALKMIQEKYKEIPVMFLTGRNDPETEARGFEMGVVDFITKPFFGPVLLGRIKKQLQIEDTIRELKNKLKEVSE